MHSRQCTDYIIMLTRHNYVGADGVRMARVMFAVGEAVWCLSRWHCRAVVPDLHLHHQRMLSSTINYIYLSRAYQTV